MASASDKARFHLEQGIPELREWERRELFSRSEIAMIARKRSDFEHILASRAPLSADFVRYIEFEMNVSALVQTKSKRQSIKVTRHAGDKRIFGILNRATIKCRGDFGLWMQYLTFCRSRHANQRLQRVLTEALRLFPKNESLWIWSAQWYFEEMGDMPHARLMMQKSLRFNPESIKLYVEFARLELAYLAKIVARKQILGIEQSVDLQTSNHDATSMDDSFDSKADMVAFPLISDVDLLGHGSGDHGEHRQSLSAKPQEVQGGLIPKAIFESALQKVASPSEVIAATFFDLFAEFSMSCVPQLLDYALAVLSRNPASPVYISRQTRRPLHGLDPTSAEYVEAFQKALKAVRSTSDLPRAVRQPLLMEYESWLSSLSKDSRALSEIRQTARALARRLRPSRGQELSLTGQ